MLSTPCTLFLVPIVNSSNISLLPNNHSIFKLAPGAWAMFPFGKGYESMDDEMFQSPAFLQHAKNVVGMLDSAVNFLGPDLQILEETLITLGANHIGYGVLPEHYPIVGQALLETLATALGDAFTPELKEAWTGVYGFITASMLKGANESLLRLRLYVYGDDDEKMSLDECVSKRIPGQKDLYYTTSEEASPQVERLHKAGVIVMVMEPRKKDKVVANLEKYLGRKMVDVADEGLDLSFLDPPKEDKQSPSPTSVTQIITSDGLDFNDAQDFCVWFQAELGPEKVVACTPTCKFTSLPARVTVHEGQDIQKTIRQLEDFDCMPLPKKHVEINPSHEFIVEIHKVRQKYPEIASMMAQQVHDNCLINAGLMDDCRGMVNRITDISMCLLKCKNDSVES